MNYMEIGMFKNFLLLVVFMPMMVYAEYSFTKKDLIGDWICVTEEDGISSQAIMRYHADGTANEIIEVVDKSTYYPLVNFMIANYAWQLKGNKLHMGDLNDLPYYDYYYVSPQSLEKVDEQLTQEMYEETVESFQKHNWHYIEFDDKDTHHYIFEGGSSGTCQRLK